MFPIEDFFEGADGFGHGHLLAFAPGKDLSDSEWLAEESLDFARTENGQFIVGRELIHTENSDNVLQIFVALQHLLNAAGDIVMFLSNNFGREGARVGRQWIHSGEDAQLSDGTFQDDR